MLIKFFLKNIYIVYFLLIVTFIFVISCNHLTKSESTDCDYINIDLFTIPSYKTLKSYQIKPSTGNILEYSKSPESTMIYAYSLNKIEIDSIKTFLYLIQLSNTIENEFDNCVHGITYQLTVNTKDDSIEIKNIICDDKNIADEMVLYILNITKNKNKKLIFENYMKYQNFLKNTDSILKIETYSDF